MRISWIITLPGLLSAVSALAIQKRDADFYSVRTKAHKDMSGRRGDPSGKYFRKFSSRNVLLKVYCDDRDVIGTPLFELCNSFSRNLANQAVLDR